MDAEFDDLKREFLAEADEKVREIRKMLAEGGVGRDSLDRMLYLSHQLKGAGGSYGFSRISTEAAAMEAALEKSLESSQPLPDGVRVRVDALAAEIDARMLDLASTVSPETELLPG